MLSCGHKTNLRKNYICFCKLYENLDRQIGDRAWDKINRKISLLLLSRFSRVRLCDPMDCSLQDSSVQGISQARVLEWVAIAFSERCPYTINNKNSIQIVQRANEDQVQRKKWHLKKAPFKDHPCQIKSVEWQQIAWSSGLRLGSS